ncbi:MAG TPA: hypothetical protein VED40_23340 [Azospirillaceae bacterium]|nr:hypothetical protein [Azospirillaceae bacterium]
MPGVYAWYFSPEITDYDLECLVSDIESLKAVGDNKGAASLLAEFMLSNVFSYFAEQPYQATLTGPLMPKYTGTIHHAPALSPDLVARLVDEPSRLLTLKRVLEGSAPYFSSPLYIGMSDSLRTRLMQHKRLIERLQDAPAASEGFAEDRDHSFAREVVARGMPTARLFVIAEVIDTSDRSYVDVENILNRIHYPLLGRN